MYALPEKSLGQEDMAVMKTKRYPNPQFHSFEEEEKYWEEHGPLAEGHRGRWHKPKEGEKHSSFLCVRLTGSEITELRDIAKQAGLGPCTYARLVLTGKWRLWPRDREQEVTP